MKPDTETLGFNLSGSDDWSHLLARRARELVLRGTKPYRKISGCAGSVRLTGLVGAIREAAAY